MRHTPVRGFGFLVPVILIALVAVGAYASRDSLSSMLAAALQSDTTRFTPRAGIVAAAVATISATTTPTTFHRFSYTGLDKGTNGPVQNVLTQAQGLPVTVTVYSNATEIAQLKALNPTALATITYQIGQDPATVGTARTLFKGINVVNMTASGTNLVGTFPLTFTDSLLPGSYVITLTVVTADKKYTLKDKFYVNVTNSAKCQIKG